jgi:hypothetical protein
LKVTVPIAIQDVKTMPDLLIGSSAISRIGGLLGLQILPQLGKKVNNGEEGCKKN